MVSVSKYLKDTEDTPLTYLYLVRRYKIFVSVATLCKPNPGLRPDAPPCIFCLGWQLCRQHFLRPAKLHCHPHDFETVLRHNSGWFRHNFSEHHAHLFWKYFSLEVSEWKASSFRPFFYVVKPILHNVGIDHPNFFSAGVQGGPSGCRTQLVDIKFIVPSQFKLIILKRNSYCNVNKSLSSNRWNTP